MDKPAFTYDDVRVTPDCQIGLNSHPQWELSHVVRGTGNRVIGDKKEPIVEGETILIPPGIPHVWHFDTTNTDEDGCIANITIFFENDTLEGIATFLPETRACIRKILTLTEAVSYSGTNLDNIVAILYSIRDRTAEARIPDMLRLLMVISDTESCRIVGRNNSLSRTEQLLERIRTFCACNYGREISLDEISRYAGMNKSTFCSFMKRHTGHTFSEYVNEHRLCRAVERIKSSGENIAEIAFSVGFSNVTYFNRLFRARYGCTPKAMRYESTD